MRNQYAMYQDSWPLNPEAASWYRTHSGTLNYYASAMRYDIAYATSQLSQFKLAQLKGRRQLCCGYSATSRAPQILASVAGSTASPTRFVSTVTLITGDFVSWMACHNLV